ncbi:MAG TPA: hypothetical protein VFA89_22160 [Terriglobales bacterium]|nr:hypothetical protein [Terriglobales bacterium]
MDNILLIMFGSLICVTTALTFMEVHRIRKKLDVKEKAVIKPSV